MVKKTAYLGLFSAIAIIFGYVESLLPIFIGIPGIKLGLANLAILFLLERYSFREAAMVSVIRILVIGFLFGNMFSIIYSLSGAALSLACMTFMKAKTDFPALLIFGVITGVLIGLLTTEILRRLPSKYTSDATKKGITNDH